jgi:NAD(P)-dependent dehydrogenase (short-subunit alcohol dehydrogenase family)
MDMQLVGKQALVTGSTAGIGYAIASGLASEGAEVIINGRSPDSVKQAQSAIENETGHKVLGFCGDLSTASAAEQLGKDYPAIDILVNCLGMFQVKEWQAITDADWMKLFEFNVLGGARLSRLCLPYMQAKNWGRIIFVSSESAIQIPTEMVHFGVTKAAQIALSRGLAEVTAGSGITVNTVLPGPTKTRDLNIFTALNADSEGAFESFQKDFFENRRPTSLLKRFAAPKEVASMVVYLASPIASATTGATMRVEGGIIKSAF